MGGPRQVHRVSCVWFDRLTDRVQGWSTHVCDNDSWLRFRQSDGTVPSLHLLHHLVHIWRPRWLCRRCQGNGNDVIQAWFTGGTRQICRNKFAVVCEWRRWNPLQLLDGHRIYSPGVSVRYLLRLPQGEYAGSGADDSQRGWWSKSSDQVVPLSIYSHRRPKRHGTRRIVCFQWRNRIFNRRHIRRIQIVR